jgi:hypothetical protein
MGRETTPGVPAAITHPVLVSDNAVAWQATLEPFRAELPPGSDWVEFVRTFDPQGDPDRVLRRWSDADQRNPALEAVLPVGFVRRP